MNELHARGITLVPQCAAHADAMFTVLADPAIYEFENAPPTSLAALRARYTRLETRRSPDGTQRWLNWVIRLPDDVLAGYVQATVLASGDAYVAYELGSAHWRQGIASAAVEAVLAELAATYGVQRAHAVLKAANYRSR
ncbi:MAG: GNAT family N-acetyltransferase, partial [Proteobacteria bacterium]|nr:GNAT family N-acetyltransferase [Pseudomonadota bacterium]